MSTCPLRSRRSCCKEYGSQKAAEKALEEKYGEMARHPIVKMSKSLGNVINPDEVVDQYGADTMRLYEMFMGDFEQAAPWQTSAIAGCNRFLDRVWALSDKLVEGEGYRPAMETLMHQTIKKVGADIEGLKMNTAIAQLMTLVNALYDNGGATKAEFETLVQLLNPFAPHMTEELWEKLGHSHDEQLAYYPWPAYEEAKCVEATVEIAVQVNGKVKARLKVAADITAEDAIAAAKADPAVAAALEGKTAGQGDLRQGPSGQSGCQGLSFAAPLNKREHIITRRGRPGAGNTRQRLFKNLSKVLSKNFQKKVDEPDENALYCLLLVTM